MIFRWKCNDEESICFQKGKASRRWWESGVSRKAGKITFEQSGQKTLSYRMSSSGRYSAVIGNHITSVKQNLPDLYGSV